MINKERLRQKALKYDISLDEKQLEKFELYAKNIVEWNAKINLTAITDEEGIENKHFIDSLLFANCKEVKGKVVDIGSGAGFPGVVCSVYKEDLDMTLIEPTGKRVVFLNHLINVLNLNSCTAVKERAEEAARKQWRESFDVACARAVAAMPMLCEYCLPLVKKGGLFIALKGRYDEELSLSKNAISKLGGKFEKVEQFVLPEGEERSLIFIRKVEETPNIYPRNGGVIAKRPL